jgi:hypothetical protein
MPMTSQPVVLLALVALAGCERSESMSPGGTDSGATTSGATTDTGSTGADDQALAHELCDCMLVHCHDDFHEEWGESDLEATLNCRDEAAMLPRKGEPTLQGDFLECRLGHCEAAAEGDPSWCAGALGESPCD